MKESPAEMVALVAKLVRTGVDSSLPECSFGEAA